MTETAQSGAPCPSCGVVVAAGYVKCPRCHNALKGPGAARAKRGSMHGGATSLADSDGNPLAWILGGAAVIAVAVVGVLLLRGGNSPSDENAGRTQVTVAANPNGASGQQGGAGGAPPLDTERPGTNPAAAGSAADAVRVLQAALQANRIWASTAIDTNDSTIVTIQSGQCEESAMREALDDARQALKQAAFVVVRCIAQHGTDVFQERL